MANFLKDSGDCMVFYCCSLDLDSPESQNSLNQKRKKMKKKIVLIMWSFDHYFNQIQG